MQEDVNLALNSLMAAINNLVEKQPEEGEIDGVPIYRCIGETFRDTVVDENKKNCFRSKGSCCL